MDNWLPAHRKADGGNGPYVMGYYTRDDIPFQFTLAEAFTVCDSYFCTIMRPTHLNRFYLMTGTNDPTGWGGGPALDNSGTSYTKAASDSTLWQNGMIKYPAGEFEYDAINAAFVASKESEHHDSLPATARAAGRDSRRVRWRTADRWWLPRADHHRVALDSGWVGVQRELRPHLGSAVAGAGDRGGGEQHLFVAAQDVW
jgi:hypothetical protein